VQKWEYQAVPMVIVNLGPRQIKDELNNWGADGWELISTLTMPPDPPKGPATAQLSAASREEIFLI
jgi:hypothetical protein